jgi:lipopolysaccharide/colanic/teichoic acid biosynthesis glycosyltransferase
MQMQFDASADWTGEWVAIPPGWFSYVTVKRLIDVVLATLVLIASLPIWIAIAIAIKLDSPGPVFFIQERVGENGRRFRCLKFRSMRVNAEAELEEMRRRGEVNGMSFKIPNDPRVTRIGRLLRRTSLDEFPQFINVLKGEMSLVGPRPLIPSQIEQFRSEDLIRLRARPGLTCLWVVDGRSDCSFAEWMEYDREYVRRRSLRLDAWIIARTVVVVFSGRGAY